MEVAPPLNHHHPTDFNFDFDFNFSAYVAPSTPRLMGDDNSCSTPTSPTRASELHREFEQLLIMDNTHRRTSLAAVPFAWEVKPGVPKSTAKNLFDGDFAFDVISAEFYPDHDSFVSAEDLFHGGMIKRAEFDQPERGRARSTKTTSSSNNLPSSRSRRTRSLPPFRGFEQQEQQQPPIPATATNPNMPTSCSSCTTLSASGSGKWSKKWSFKDLFLFRSASDGRALDKDPFKKYSATFRKHDEDFKNSSLRDRNGSGSGSGSKRKGRVSAHELHYTVNRAVSNDMKKKTFLPYKQGILGRLAFNPTVDALSNGFGFSHHNN